MKDKETKVFITLFAKIDWILEIKALSPADFDLELCEIKETFPKEYYDLVDVFLK